MSEIHHFVRVDFHRFKAFENFILHLRHFNILVGPNNAGKSPSTDEATVNEKALAEIETRWNDDELRLSMIPGKDALGRVNEHLQHEYGITVTSTGIIESMKSDEVPDEMMSLVAAIDSFACLRPGAVKG